MDARTELEQLLAGLFDGAPGVAGNRRLCELLREHPELQDEYLNHLQLHALLEWRGGTVGSSPFAPRKDAPPRNDAPFAERKATLARGGRAIRRGLVAALLILAAGLGGFFFVSSQQARATPDPVERLIDWNLDLTQARSAEDRTRIFAERASELEAAVAKAKLPLPERELAKTLLENGNWLAGNTDPVAESSRFNDIAEMMLAEMDSAATAKNAEHVARLTESYCRITQLGIEANIERALQDNSLDGERKERLGRCMNRNADRADKLTTLADQSPDECRKHFRRASKSSSKYGKRNRDNGDREERR